MLLTCIIVNGSYLFTFKVFSMFLWNHTTVRLFQLCLSTWHCTIEKKLVFNIWRCVGEMTGVCVQESDCTGFKSQPWHLQTNVCRQITQCFNNEYNKNYWSLKNTKYIFLNNNTESIYLLGQGTLICEGESQGFFQSLEGKVVDLC